MNRGGIRNRDPNIYVYTPAFAQHFQMPVQWESKALQGADAVAFRVMPTYATCGWGATAKLAVKTKYAVCWMCISISSVIRCPGTQECRRWGWIVVKPHWHS